MSNPPAPPYWVFGFGEDRPNRLFMLCDEAMHPAENNITRLRIYWDANGWYSDVGREHNGCELMAVYESKHAELPADIVKEELTDKMLYDLSRK